MKIMKKLSTFLAAAMLVSTLVVPASAAGDWNEVLNDNFESYADDAALEAAWKDVYGKAAPTVVSDTGSKVMKFIRTGDNNNLVERKLAEEITSGEVIYKGKVKIKHGANSDGGKLLFGVRNKAGNQSMNFVYLAKEGMYSNTTWAGGAKFSGYTAGSENDKWFEAEAKINMDTHKYDVTVSDGTNTYTLTNQSMVNVGTDKAMTDIGSVFIQTWGGEADATELYLDDVSVSKYVEQPAEPWFSDNFEDYADDAALKAVWKNVYGNAAPMVVSDTGSKVMKFIRTGDDNNLVERKLAKEITSGEVVYKGKVKIKHGANSDGGKLMVGVRNKAGSQSMNFVYLEKAGMYSNTTWAGGAKFSGHTAGSENDKWFEVEAKINMDTHKYDVTVSDGTNAYTLTNQSMVNVGTDKAMTDIGSVFIQTWGGEADATELYLDDVSVSEYKESEPDPDPEPSEG